MRSLGKCEREEEKKKKKKVVKWGVGKILDGSSEFN